MIWLYQKINITIAYVSGKPNAAVSAPSKRMGMKLSKN